MEKYVITLDAGTTNTRAMLWDSRRQACGTQKESVGVRNTAIDGHNKLLKKAVKSCLERLLAEAGIGYDSVQQIIASGMITSNVGLVEVPHLVAPVALDDFARGITPVTIEEVCPLPICFIPGVKNYGGTITTENFETMDIMRGEEVESIAVSNSFPRGKAYLLVLPGSHTKFVGIDPEGSITGCLTSITGELLASITNDTIIADAVDRKFVEEETYDKSMLLLGYDVAKKTGLGRACFSARILNQFSIKEKEKIANYILGAALQSDVAAVLGSSALAAGKQTEIIVAGKNPLRQAIADVLTYEGCFANVHTFVPEDDRPLSAIGAYLVSDRADALQTGKPQEREQNK